MTHMVSTSHEACVHILAKAHMCYSSRWMGACRGKALGGIVVVQRARLQQSQVLRGVVLVLGALALLVCVALTLDLMLTKVGRAKDIASIVQSFATALAIVTGGIYALYKFQVFRTLEPHLTIEHRISHRRLSDSYVHIALTAMLHNSSRVHVELREGLFRLQGVSPGYG